MYAQSPCMSAFAYASMQLLAKTVLLMLFSMLFDLVSVAVLLHFLCLVRLM